MSPVFSRAWVHHRRLSAPKNAPVGIVELAALAQAAGLGGEVAGQLGFQHGLDGGMTAGGRLPAGQLSAGQLWTWIP